MKIKSSWTKTEFEGFPAWIGETDLMSLCVIPSLGSKLISLKDKRTYREWLWRSGKPLGNQGYGTSFGAGDESGWDEMFPGINQCRYPDTPWEGKKIPDHGEVWSLAWSDELTEKGLSCQVEGVQFPYVLKKQYSFFTKDTFRIEYKLKNTSPYPFSFLWAAHPLFQVHEGMRLYVPDSLNEIVISYSKHNRLGAYKEHKAWPKVQQKYGALDLSVIEEGNTNFAEKYFFTGKLIEGYAALSDPSTKEAITLRFPADKVPYLAIWANYGGYGGYYHFAIEPATGMLDDLSYAMGKKAVMSIEPHGEYEWFLEVSLNNTIPS